MCFEFGSYFSLSETHVFHQSVHGLLGSLGVAFHAQYLAVQWVAAICIRLYGEGAGAILTPVTLEVEVFIQSHDSDRLLASRGRNDGLVTAHTQRRETPVIILDTVGVVVVVCDEGRPLQATGAGGTEETVGVETLAHCLQHTVSNPLSTAGAHRQGTHIAVLTLRRSVPVVELHALQGAMAAHAAEAVGVEELVHGSDGRLGARQGLLTLSTHLRGC